MQDDFPFRPSFSWTRFPVMLRVAIVGRPNVGKSALLNRLARRTVSIVHDQPGITRDRISVLVRNGDLQYELVDTGGIGLFENEMTPKVISEAVEMQADIAIASADVILLVADGLEGLAPLDEEIASKLRRSGRKLWLAINKVDLEQHEARAIDIHRLGIKPSFFVSASHGRGIPELWEALERENRRLDAIRSVEDPERALDKDKPIAAKIAIIGRPNVGKSSLANRLLGSERVIVSEIPGTTRDSVELNVEFDSRRYVLVDTAGIRQKVRIDTNVEMYSRHWTEKAIMRADIVLLVLSALDGPTRQDREIAGMIQEYQKPCIILVNKWDLNETLRVEHLGEAGNMHKAMRKRRAVPQSEYEESLRTVMPWLEYAPILFISALEGYQASRIWQEIGKVSRARRTTFTTGVLNRLFTRAQDKQRPPATKGQRLKIFYFTQKMGAAVPTFMAFVNQRKLWDDKYARYLANRLREDDPLLGCPVLFEVRERLSKEPEGGVSRNQSLKKIKIAHRAKPNEHAHTSGRGGAKELERSRGRGKRRAGGGSYGPSVKKAPPSGGKKDSWDEG